MKVFSGIVGLLLATLLVALALLGLWGWILYLAEVAGVLIVGLLIARLIKSLISGLFK